MPFMLIVHNTRISQKIVFVFWNTDILYLNILTIDWSELRMETDVIASTSRNEKKILFENDINCSLEDFWCRLKFISKSKGKSIFQLKWSRQFFLHLLQSVLSDTRVHNCETKPDQIRTRWISPMSFQSTDMVLNAKRYINYSDYVVKLKVQGSCLCEINATEIPC